MNLKDKFEILSNPENFKIDRDHYTPSYRSVIVRGLYYYCKKFHGLNSDINTIRNEFDEIQKELGQMQSIAENKNEPKPILRENLYEFYAINLGANYGMKNIIFYVDKSLNDNNQKGTIPLIFYPYNNKTSTERTFALSKSIADILKNWDDIFNKIIENIKINNTYEKCKNDLCSRLEIRE